MIYVTDSCIPTMNAKNNVVMTVRKIGRTSNIKKRLSFGQTFLSNKITVYKKILHSPSYDDSILEFIFHKYAEKFRYKSTGGARELYNMTDADVDNLISTISKELPHYQIKAI